MRLKILGGKALEEPESEVFVSLEADDESGISVIFHINKVSIDVAWISKRGKIIISGLTQLQQNLLRGAGFKIIDGSVMVEN